MTDYPYRPGAEAAADADFEYSHPSYMTDELDERGRDELECLEDGDDCRGEVDMWTTDGLKYWPRCEFHGERRLAAYENSIERYANSTTAPSWFDETAAGERWDDDY